MSPNQQSQRQPAYESQPAATTGATGLNECERCGGSLGLPVDTNTFPKYEIPDTYDIICRDCAPDVNTLTIESLSDEELIAAIISDSIGYASPTHAARHVRRYRDDSEDNTAYCERASSCFDNDLTRLIKRARDHWASLADDKRETLLERVTQWKAVEDEHDVTASMTISAFWPTSP